VCCYGVLLGVAPALVRLPFGAGWVALLAGAAARFRPLSVRPGLAGPGRALRDR
jgi:hypothetical protein